MKRLITLLLVICTVPAFSQSANEHVKQASAALEKADYIDAWRHANSALQNKSSISKDKDKCEAYYVRANASMEIVNKAKFTKIDEAMNDLVTASTDLMQVEELGCKSHKSLVAEAKVKLHETYQKFGLGLLNQAYQINLTPTDRKQLYDLSAKLLSADIKIAPNDYMSYDLLAQAQLAGQDSAEAYNNFTLAASKYNEFPPANADQLIAYVYYRKALIERYSMHDLRKAMSTIEAGEQALEKANKLLKATTDQPIGARADGQYKDAKADLNAFKLDIYLNSPEMYTEALQNFEKAIKENPKSYSMHVAYASLLEQSDKAKAIEMYNKAIVLDDNKSLAHFNLGALYINDAADAGKKSNEESDFEKAQYYMDEMNKYMEKAYPHMKKCNELEPCDTTTIQSLLQITLSLELLDEYKKYKEMRTDCGY